MAGTASVLTDLGQTGAAVNRSNMSEIENNERLRSILRLDADAIAANALEPNRRVEDQARSRPQASGQETPRARSVIDLPPDIPTISPAEERLDRFKLLQKWEGTVLCCSETEFTAVLREQGEPDQEATFDVEEVPEGDRALIVPGAIFHWSIGYRDRRGQRIRESIIRFRRLPAWNRREIERARQEADEFITVLHWGELQTTR